MTDDAIADLAWRCAERITERRLCPAGGRVARWGEADRERIDRDVAPFIAEFGRAVRDRALDEARAQVLACVIPGHTVGNMIIHNICTRLAALRAGKDPA